MRKKLVVLCILLLSSQCFAGQITVFKTYGVNDQVTAANFNGNISNIVTVVNGQLDNTNANTASGFRFYEVLGALPAAGTEGRTVYLTTADTINFDTGSAWRQAISITTPVQGDIIYYNGTDWTALTAGTSGKLLQTNGAGANPTWGGSLPWAQAAWVTWDSAGTTILDSYNVTSLTNGGVGSDTVNFSITFGNTNYCVEITLQGNAFIGNVNAKAATTCSIYVNDSAGGAADKEVNFFAFGD